MRVLVVESDRHVADRAITDLQAAGHHVVRCHEVDLTAFPCNALCDQGTCELEHDRSVDVVLDYRAHPYPRPTPLEDGVSCALRHDVPVVVAGTSALNPFDKWTTAVAHDHDIVATCERAATMPIERLAAPARNKVRQLLSGQSDVAEEVEVLVFRDGSRLRVTVFVPDEAETADGALAVAAAGVLRSHNRWASGVDVSVRRFPSGEGHDLRQRADDRRH